MNINLSNFFKSWWNWAFTLLPITALLVGIAVSAKKTKPVLADTERSREVLLHQRVFKPVPSVTTTKDPLPMTVLDNQPLGLADAKPAAPEFASAAEVSTTAIPVKSASGNFGVPGPGSGMSLAAASPLAAASSLHSAPDNRLRLPLAFAPVDPQNLTPTLQSKLPQLPNQSVQAAGDTQNPTPSVNDRRWVDPQIEANDRYRAFFGNTAFNAMEIQQAQQAQKATP